MIGVRINHYTVLDRVTMSMYFNNGLFNKEVCICTLSSMETNLFVLHSDIQIYSKLPKQHGFFQKIKEMPFLNNS